MAHNIKDTSIDKAFDVVKRLRQGESLTRATKEEHTTRKTFRRANAELDLVESKEHQAGKRLEFEFHEAKTATFIDNNGVLHEDIPLEKRSLSTYGKYLNDVKYAGTLGRNTDLSKYDFRTLRDVYGNRYLLMTDYDTLLALIDSYNVNTEDIIKS